MTSDYGDLEIEIISSRRGLIDVIAGLADQREALTVLGGHAVIEVTQGVPSLPPDDTTRDGDLGVIPQLLTETPNLSTRMTELGYEAARPERPGVWSPVSQRDRSIHDRDSVDLIAPMSLARGSLTTGRSIRAARVGAHGTHAVSATRGTELSVLDRQWRTLRAFDGGSTIDAYVAGPSALLCAKAYKIHDRLDPTEFRRNADRLRSKDFADLYRLLLVIAPEDAAGVFARGIAAPDISDAVALGRDYLIEILTDAATVASMVADAWGDTSREAEFHARRRQLARTLRRLRSRASLSSRPARAQVTGSFRAVPLATAGSRYLRISYKQKGRAHDPQLRCEWLPMSILGRGLRLRKSDRSTHLRAPSSQV